MMFIKIKNTVRNTGKNLLGWKTDRKIIVFAVDDYGNVRIDSPRARKNLTKAGVVPKSRFDAYDTLETREDLEMLFQTLSSVKDNNGRNAIFTCYAVPCNINFEKVADTRYQQYKYEVLTETFEKKSNYDFDNYSGAWGLWKTGMEEGLFIPQFHGREHFNLRIFKNKLREGDEELLLQLKNRSLTYLTDNNYPNISGLAAFDFWDPSENNAYKKIIRDGLEKFDAVFGSTAKNFTPPAYSAHPALYQTLKENGIEYIDSAFIGSQHLGNGQYRREINYTGKMSGGVCKIVRNVVFEPTSNYSIDWSSYALKQIEAAFRWKRAVIISSHRVNFCGLLDPENRENGLSSLDDLLKKIVHKWPDVEFMGANELGELVKASIR